MALEDFFDRLMDISSAGTRETDYQGIRGQRSRNKRDFEQALKQDQARKIAFAVSIPKQNYQNQRIKPPVQSQKNPIIDLAESLKGFKFDQHPLRSGYRSSSGYGPRKHPISGKHSTHTGVDWATKSGSPIYAPSDAVVRSTDWNKIYGNRTILDFGQGLSSMFGHQSGYTVKPGQRVKAGQLIGYVGSTGRSTGPHLHFETWINNKPVNPLSWFM